MVKTPKKQAAKTPEQQAVQERLAKSREKARKWAELEKQKRSAEKLNANTTPVTNKSIRKSQSTSKKVAKSSTSKAVRTNRTSLSGRKSLESLVAAAAKSRPKEIPDDNKNDYDESEKQTIPISKKALNERHRRRSAPLKYDQAYGPNGTPVTNLSEQANNSEESSEESDNEKMNEETWSPPLKSVTSMSKASALSNEEKRERLKRSREKARAWAEKEMKNRNLAPTRLNYKKEEEAEEEEEEEEEKETEEKEEEDYEPSSKRRKNLKEDDNEKFSTPMSSYATPKRSFPDEVMIDAFDQDSGDKSEPTSKSSFTPHPKTGNVYQYPNDSSLDAFSPTFSETSKSANSFTPIADNPNSVAFNRSEFSPLDNNPTLRAMNSLPTPPQHLVRNNQNVQVTHQQQSNLPSQYFNTQPVHATQPVQQKPTFQSNQPVHVAHSSQSKLNLQNNQQLHPQYPSSDPRQKSADTLMRQEAKNFLNEAIRMDFTQETPPQQQSQYQHIPETNPITNVIDTPSEKKSVSFESEFSKQSNLFPETLKSNEINQNQEKVRMHRRPTPVPLKRPHYRPVEKTVFQRVLAFLGYFDSLLGFILKIFMILFLCLYINFALRDSASSIETYEDITNTEEVPFSPLIPPCFLNSPGTDVEYEIEDLKFRECDSTDLKQCPDYGFCAIGFLINCAAPFSPTENYDNCIPPPGIVEEIASKLKNLTVTKVCSTSYMISFNSDESPLFTLDAEYEVFYPYLSKQHSKDFIFDENTNTIGLSSELVKNDLIISTQCFIKFQLFNCILFVFKALWFILQLGLSFSFSYPLQTFAVIFFTYIYNWMQSRRRSRKYQKVMIQKAQNLIIQKLKKQENSIQINHLRDTIAYELHEASLKDRKQFALTVWPKAVSIMKHDTRIKRYPAGGNRSGEFWKWDAPK